MSEFLMVLIGNVACYVFGLGIGIVIASPRKDTTTHSAKEEGE